MDAFSSLEGQESESLLDRRYLTQTDDKKRCYIIRPVNNCRKQIGAVLIHGHGTNFENTIVLRELATRLWISGVPICIVDFDEIVKTYNDLDFYSLAERGEFAKCAMDQFCSDSKLSSENVWVFGHSIGGLTAIQIGKYVICINTPVPNSSSFGQFLSETEKIMFDNPNPEFSKKLLGDYHVCVTEGMRVVNFCHRADFAINKGVWIAQGLEVVEFGESSGITTLDEADSAINASKMSRFKWLLKNYYRYHNVVSSKDREELFGMIFQRMSPHNGLHINY